MPTTQDIVQKHKRLLVDLGAKGSDRVQAIFVNATTSLRQPRNLRALVDAIDALDWYSAKTEGLGELYEGPLEWLASPLGRTSIIKTATSAAGLYTLSLAKVDGLPVPLAPTKEQDVLVRVIENSVARMASVERFGLDLAALRLNLDRSVLGKAFRGELIPQDPNDEPADVMLARLRDANDAGDDGKARRKATSGSAEQRSLSFNRVNRNAR